MDWGSGRVLRFFPGPCAGVGRIANGGVTMDWTTTLALVVALVLVLYLTAALLKPEMFS